MRKSLLSYCNFVNYETYNNNNNNKTFKIYFIFCSRTMNAFYSIQFTDITSKTALMTLLMFERSLLVPWVFKCSLSF